MTEVVFHGDPCSPDLGNPMNVVIDLKVLGAIPKVGDAVAIGPSTSSCWVTDVVWVLNERKRDPKTNNWVPENPRRHPWRVMVRLSYRRPNQ